MLVRIRRDELDSLQALRETRVSASQGTEVTLGTVADLRVEEGPSEIRQIRGDLKGSGQLGVRNTSLQTGCRVSGFGRFSCQQ